MAEKASIESMQEAQKKMAEQIALMERTVHSVFRAITQLFGDKVPAYLKKLADEWEQIDTSDDVIVKTAKVMLLEDFC